jgi:carbonic anhydrase/acetyltransferase-like protein (isoleucine patch superfamily)
LRLKAYRWCLGSRIELLGDAAVDVPVGNVPLGERQREVFARGGAEVVDVEELGSIPDRELLLFADNLFVSWPLLRRFLRALASAPGTEAGVRQLGLRVSALTELTQFTGEQARIEDTPGGAAILFRLYHVRLGPQDSLLSALENAEPVVLDPWVKSITIPFSSRIPTMTDMRLPVTDAVALELTSWVHVWLANLLYIGVWLLGLLRSPQGLAWLLYRALLGLAGAFSLRPYRILTSIAGKLVVRGRGCRIHPSAVVEASVLGRGVEIGPLCVVRGSILGDGVQVMEQSVVDGSVLGDGVIVNQQGMIKVCVAYPKAVFSWMQAGLVGRRAFLGRLCRPLDMKYQGVVRVRHRGRLLSTGMPFLGCCIGHGAFISADSHILPGRAIPNDYKIMSDYTRYIDQVPDDLPTDWLLLERAGRLEPLIPARLPHEAAPAATGSLLPAEARPASEDARGRTAPAAPEP